MKRYAYKAKDKSGKLVTGEVEAATLAQGVKLVRAKGLFVITIKLKVGSIFDFIKNFLRKYYTKWINLFALFELIKIVNKFNINIIHSNSSVVSIGYKLSKIKSINHVWHLREYIHPNYDLFVYDGLEKYKNKVKNSKNKICITKGVANEFGLEQETFILKDAVRKKPKFTKPVLKSNYFLFFCHLVCTRERREDLLHDIDDLNLE